MKEYEVTLTHTEKIIVTAKNEGDAIHEAYKAAECQCVWDEVDIEEVEQEY